MCNVSNTYFKREIRGIKEARIEKVAWSAMRLKAETLRDGCPARNIRSLVGDKISPDLLGRFHSVCPYAENEGVNELLRHCCPFVLRCQSKLPESLLVVRYELPSVRLEKSHMLGWD
ncbi:hypothetical protein TNCV_1552211 [Trichonephila clavipes]|nr:hypothetical protein TNCV_1552211 [Trichonephila clavipes]